MGNHSHVERHDGGADGGVGAVVEISHEGDWEEGAGEGGRDAEGSNEETLRLAGSSREARKN